MILGIAAFIAFGIWIGFPWWLWALLVAAYIELAVEASL